MAFVKLGKVNYLLRPGGTLLGRAGYCDISFDDPEVSKEHALIVGTSDGYYILDLKSTNGTRVQSVEVGKAALRDGDVISVGTTEFIFYFETAQDMAEFGELLEDVYTLDGTDRIVQTFPFSPFGMENLLQRSHRKALSELHVLYWLASGLGEERLEMRILRLSADTIGARRGNLSVMVGERSFSAALGLGGAHLPAGVSSIARPFVGPPIPSPDEGRGAQVPDEDDPGKPSSGADETGHAARIAPEAGGEPEPSGEGPAERTVADEPESAPLDARSLQPGNAVGEDENVAQTQEPYLFFPLPSGGGHVYLEDPAQKKRFGEEDIASVGQIVAVGLQLLLVQAEGEEDPCEGD